MKLAETLKDIDTELPHKTFYYDPEDEKVKKITLTRDAINTTLKTFEDEDKVANKIKQKYLSKQLTPIKAFED